MNIIPIFLIDATDYVYKGITRQVTTIQICVSLKHVLLCAYFGFTAPSRESCDLMLVMYCMEALSHVTRKELTSYDPLR